MLPVQHRVAMEGKNLRVGSSCGSVGRAVPSNTRYPRFESSHWQNLAKSMFYCIEMTKIKEAGNGSLKIAYSIDCRPEMQKWKEKRLRVNSGCGSVGRDPRFESSHQQIFI